MKKFTRQTYEEWLQRVGSVDLDIVTMDVEYKMWARWRKDNGLSMWSGCCAATKCTERSLYDTMIRLMGAMMRRAWESAPLIANSPMAMGHGYTPSRLSIVTYIFFFRKFRAWISHPHDYLEGKLTSQQSHKSKTVDTSERDWILPWQAVTLPLNPFRNTH